MHNYANYLFKPLCLISENEYTELPLMAESLLGHTEKVKRLLDHSPSPSLPHYIRGGGEGGMGTRLAGFSVVW